MGWTGTTLLNMTEDLSGDLVLDDFCDTGSVTSGALDASSIDSLGSCFRHIVVSWAIEANPADNSKPQYTVELCTSTDGITYSSWALYQEGDYECRYVMVRVTVYGDSRYAQRPKITQLMVMAPAADSHPWQGNIESTQNNPPGAALQGSRYLVGTGGGAFTGYDDHIAICQDPNATTYRFIPPWVGMQHFHETDDEVKLFDSDGNWVQNDARKTGAEHITILAPSWSSKPAGAGWAAWIDTAQVFNGGYTNQTAAANLDQINYKTGFCSRTYTMLVVYKKDASCGIIKVYTRIGGASTLRATIDTYAAAPANNVESRTTGIVLASGQYEIEVKVDGQNIGSGGYEAYISYLAFWPEG